MAELSTMYASERGKGKRTRTSGSSIYPSIHRFASITDLVHCVVVVDTDKHIVSASYNPLFGRNKLGTADWQFSHFKALQHCLFDCSYTHTHARTHKLYIYTLERNLNISLLDTIHMSRSMSKRNFINMSKNARGGGKKQPHILQYTSLCSKWDHSGVSYNQIASTIINLFEYYNSRKVAKKHMKAFFLQNTLKRDNVVIKKK